MRRQIAFILTAAIAVTMFAGCNKETLTEGSTLPSDTSATDTSSDGPAYDLPTFEEYYGPQLQNYLDHQYYFDGEAVPNAVTNFYFINEFEEMSSYAYYGYYPATTMGRIDLSAEAPMGGDYATYGDLFVSQAEYSLESDLIKIARAKEENFVSEELAQTVDTIMESIYSDASSYNMSFEQYIQRYYWTTATEESFREILEYYYLAAYYTQYCNDNYAAEREGNTVPYVRYALFYAPETSDQAQKDMALECANALKDTSTSIDNLTELSEEAYGMGTAYDYGDIAVFKRDEVPSEFAVVPEFEEWAYGADRTENEIDIIYAPKYGYFVVGYLGLKEPDASEYAQMAAYELENSVKYDIENDTHDLHTDDEYLPSPAAPTETPVPTATPTTQDMTMPSLSTDMAGTGTAPVQSGQKVDSVTVLIIVFITLACVAVLAVIVILIVYAMNNYKKETAIKAEIAKSKRKAIVEDDDEDDEDKDDDDDEDDDESDSEDGDETDKDEESEESEEAEESDEEDEDPDVSEDSEEDDE